MEPQIIDKSRVWYGEGVPSPCSIKFDGMYVKLAFSGSKRLRLWMKMSTSGQVAARKFLRISGDRRFFFLRVDKPQFVNALRLHEAFCFMEPVV